MPLRDHFRGPLDKMRHWEGFHGQWPAMLVQGLLPKLPGRYFAEPRVHPGGSAEIDVGTFHDEEVSLFDNGDDLGEQGGVATAVWAPPRPSLVRTTDLPAAAEYEVRVFDTQRQCRLVAAVEIVNPANKDRPEHRHAFIAKCVALLQQRVSVIIVDVVTNRNFNLYADVLELIGLKDPSLGADPSPLYAAACRATKQEKTWLIETWPHTLALGQPLPTLPLWLADNLAVPLELEASYEETCRVLRIR
jgi:hypothetical protein